MTNLFNHIQGAINCKAFTPAQTVVLAIHPKGACASFATSTDTFTTNRDKSLLALFKNNAQMTFFDNTASTTEKIDYYNTRVVDFGIYIDASMRSQLQQNPAVFTLIDAQILETTDSNVGVVPTACSYGNGIDDYKDELYTRFLCGRNSEHANIGYPNGDGGATNGIDVYEFDLLAKEDIISRPSTLRWVYYTDSTNNNADFLSGTVEMGLNDMRIKAKKTLEKNGFATLFGHLHWGSVDDFDTFLSKMREFTDGYDVNFLKYTTLGEYYFIKESIDSVNLTGNIITVNYTKKDVTRPYDYITTKAWVLVNVAGTTLEDLPIQTNIPTEIIKKSDNIFAIGFDIDFDLTTQDIVLSEAVDETGYNNENVPVVSVDNSTGVITTDQPITYTLFRKLKAQSEWEVDAPIEQNDTFSSSHTIAAILDAATYDYYLGFGNEYNQFGLKQF